jgi:hypothetical protein
MMKLEYTPSAFQVRYAGAKGVLCTYPDMPGNKKCVRCTMPWVLSYSCRCIVLLIIESIQRKQSVV